MVAKEAAKRMIGGSFGVNRKYFDYGTPSGAE